MASSGKKGKKPKGKVLSLQSFLGNDVGSVKAGYSIVTTKKKDWAAEVEADCGYDDSDIKPGEQFVLPSGPMGPNVDMSKVPTSPPFTAFLGNLAHDIEKEDIEEFFSSLRVTSIRIPRPAEGQTRVRGFGYVEFDDRESLLDALSMNEKHLKSGRVKIDVADNQGDNYDPRRRDNKERSGFGGGPDRTGGDWRASSREEGSSSRPERSYGGDRDRDGPREGSRFGGGGSERNYDRGFRSSGSGPPEPGSGGGFRSTGGGAAFANRGPPGDRGGEEGGERSAFSNFRSSSSRFNESSDRDGGRSGGRRDFGGSGFRSEGGGSDYGSRFSRSGGGSNYGESAGGGGGGGGSEDGPTERPRLNLQPRTLPLEEENEVGHERPERAAAVDAPTERPRLVLQPRTRPVEENTDHEVTQERSERVVEPPSERPRLVLQPRSKPVVDEEGGGAPSAAATNRPSIFGNARPVDTAAREREIEQRLAKERTEMPSMRASTDIRLRENAAPREATSREDYPDSAGPRREAVVGDEPPAGVPVPRKARTTSSSSGGGRSPHASGGPVTLTRHSSATSETEDDKLAAPAAKQPPSPRRDEVVVVVPAPPPKENVWAKRSANVQQAPPVNNSNANHENVGRSNSVGSGTGSDSDQRTAAHAAKVIQVGK